MYMHFYSLGTGIHTGRIEPLALVVITDLALQKMLPTFVNDVTTCRKYAITHHVTRRTFVICLQDGFSLGK